MIVVRAVVTDARAGHTALGEHGTVLIHGMTQFAITIPARIAAVAAPGIIRGGGGQREAGQQRGANGEREWTHFPARHGTYSQILRTACLNLSASCYDFVFVWLT